MGEIVRSDNQAASQLAPELQAKAWLQEIGPQRPHETELQAYYRRFDAAVGLLPAELREQTDVRRCQAEGRVMAFTDWTGKKIATVNLRTKGVQIGDPPPANPTPTPRPTKKAAAQYASKEDLLRAIRKIMKAVRQRFDELEKELEQMSVRKALDGDSLAEMAARVDRLEGNLQDIADNGLRYRGYWRDGMDAKRGDAYTNDGSLWWAVRNTKDKPCAESTDWQVAVRKGRDAR